MAPNIVEGLVKDARTADYFYRREVSSDGRTMTMTFFLDEARSKMVSKRVFDRAPK